MTLAFTKMHGAGNDFVVIDGINQRVNLSAENIRQLAERRFGIGCDQLLLVEASASPDADFRYRIFNADGSEVEACGNGARCFVRFVVDKNLTEKTSIRVETLAGLISLTLEADNQVTVDMGAPVFTPQQIPFLAKKNKANSYTLNVNDESLQLAVVSMGNPHAVVRVANVDSAEVEQLGIAIQQHPDFPKQANVGFVEPINDHHIKLRVYERGSGETLACGTGACAAVVVGIQQGWLSGSVGQGVTVQLRGGLLMVNWSGNEADHVMMTGPAATVYEGVIEL